MLGLTTGLALLAGLCGALPARAQSLELAPQAGVDPSTTWYDGRLYALWKDPGKGGELEYASFDGSAWSLQAAVPGANSNVPPALAAFNGKLYAAWKGNNADQRIWYAVFNGSSWTRQASIPGAKALGAPSLSVSGNVLHAVWKGVGATLSSAGFDGTRWVSVKVTTRAAPIAANTHPFSPQAIASTALSGVDQGKYGDCVFQSAVVAVATTPRGQAALSDAITQNADGSFTVVFPGDRSHSTRVTENDLITSEVHDGAKWARVLESAIVLGYPSILSGGRPPAYASRDRHVTGSPAVYALYLLTGNPAAKDSSGAPAIGERIRQALGEGRPVVAFCADNDAGALVSGHEWTVISYQPAKGTVTLRNPWGNFRTAGTSKGGVFYDGNGQVSMTLKQFGKFYREVTFGYDDA